MFQRLGCGYFGAGENITQPAIIGLAFWGLKYTGGIGQFLCQQDHWPLPTSRLVIIHWKLSSAVPAAKRREKPCIPPYASVFFGYMALAKDSDGHEVKGNRCPRRLGGIKSTVF